MIDHFAFRHQTMALENVSQFLFLAFYIEWFACMYHDFLAVPVKDTTRDSLQGSFPHSLLTAEHQQVFSVTQPQIFPPNSTHCHIESLLYLAGFVAAGHMHSLAHGLVLFWGSQLLVGFNMDTTVFRGVPCKQTHPHLSSQAATRRSASSIRGALSASKVATQGGTVPLVHKGSQPPRQKGGWAGGRVGCRVPRFLGFALVPFYFFWLGGFPY